MPYNIMCSYPLVPPGNYVGIHFFYGIEWAVAMFDYILWPKCVSAMNHVVMTRSLVHEKERFHLVEILKPLPGFRRAESLLYENGPGLTLSEGEILRNFLHVYAVDHEDEEDNHERIAQGGSPKLAPEVGFEPTYQRLTVSCFTRQTTLD